jgi:hypothetical protein
MAELLKLIQCELTGAREAVSRLEVEKLEYHTRRLDALCCELSSIEREVRARGTAGEEALSHTDQDRRRVLIDRVRSQATEVKQLGNVYATLLRKSRRTINVLMNVLSTSSLSYRRPLAFGPPLQWEI